MGVNNVGGKTMFFENQKFVKGLLEAIKEWAVPIAAYLGIWLSIRSFREWKRQHRWKIEFDLAKKILSQLYEYHHTLLGARVRPILSYECSEFKSREFSGENDPDLLECAFRYRMSRVAKIRAKLAVSLLEAEAVWGGKLKKIFLKIFDYEQQLGMAQVKYVNDLRLGKDRSSENIEEIVFGHPNDDFERDIGALIAEFENFLRPKLKA